MLHCPTVASTHCQRRQDLDLWEECIHANRTFVIWFEYSRIVWRYLVFQLPNPASWSSCTSQSLQSVAWRRCRCRRRRLHPIVLVHHAGRKEAVDLSMSINFVSSIINGPVERVARSRSLIPTRIALAQRISQLDGQQSLLDLLIEFRILLEYPKKQESLLIVEKA